MKTFTALVGTTATTSPTTYPDSFSSLANNNSAQNVALGKSLINQQHRYLLQKYFDNERSLTFTTVGAQSLTLTGTLAIGAKTGTLTAVWPYLSCIQQVTMSTTDQRMVKFVNGSATITWETPLTAVTTTSLKTVGVRDYPIPANVSKIKNMTVTIGQLVYQPIAVQTRAEWDTINVLPYTSNIPNYFFIYNGTLGIWPIPSSTGNIVTFNYKTRVPDLSFDDFSTGSISGATVGGYSVTGTGTTWNSVGLYPLNTDITFLNLNLRINPPYGDGLWYPIQSFQSDTALTLAVPIVNAPNISSATYTIGQLPLLNEDFQDMTIFGSLSVYFSTIVKDVEKFKMYDGLYQQKMELLKDYAGTKTISVDLEDTHPINNPNLYPFGV